MISIIDVSSFTAKLKASIQKTGRLGFTEDTADALDLENKKCAKFARDDNESDVLYIAFYDEEHENSFKVTKSGAYYYLPTKLMFDAFGYDYTKKVIIFDLVRMANYDSELGGEVYKLNKREKMKKS